MDNLRATTQFEAWKLFLQSHRRLMDALGHELEAARNLPLSFFDVLAQLHFSPTGALRMHELADSVLISRSGLTRLVDRMERAGLVERRTCPSDRRGLEAVLTKAGRNAFEEAAPVHLEGVGRHFADHLTEEEAKALVSGFTKIVGAACEGKPAPEEAAAP